MLFEGVGDAITMVPASLLVDGHTHLAMKYRTTVIYNFFIFAQIFNEFNSRRINNELNVFAGIHRSVMFIAVITITVVVQIIIMLVPGIQDIFNVYSCKSNAIKPCKLDDGTRYTGVVSAIDWKAWLISIGLSLGVFIMHLIGRLLFHLKLEFSLNPKKVERDIKIEEER